MLHYLVIALIDFIVGIAAIAKARTKPAIALSFTAFSLGFWSLELYLLTVISDLMTLSFWFHLTRWGMFLIPVSLALLAWRLVGSRSQLYLRLVLIPGLVVASCLSIGNLFFFPSKLVQAPGGYLPQPDAVFYVFAAYFLWCLVGAVLLCATCYRTSTYREKQRMRWLLIIFVVSMSTGLLSIVLVSHDLYLKLIGATANIAFISLLFYATVQHHLMDIRLALSVGLARASILGFVIWTYFFINSALSEFDHSNTGVLIMLLFIVVVMEAYPRVLRWALPNAKKLISRFAYDFESVTEAARTELNICMNLKALNRVLDYLFVHIVRAKHYQFWLLENEKLKIACESKGVPADSLTPEQIETLVTYCNNNRGLIIADETPEYIQTIAEKCDCNAFFSVEYEGEYVALVLVGHTTELSFYKYDDIRIFEWLRNELGQVLNRIKRLDEMQDELGEAKKTLSMLGVMNHYHHDIKAPLAIIDGVLTNNIYDREKQREIVLEQVDRSSRLIATMAQILRGQRKRKIQPVALKEAIEDSLFVFARGLENVDMQFSEVPSIFGDAEDLKILIINVVKNAVEAKRENVPLILTIRTWATADFICLAFSDNGVGIPEVILDTMWEESHSTKLGGSGIGLQAIKRIADEHQALIDVTSIEGEGTRFILKFPMGIAVNEEVDPQQVAADPDNIFTRKGKGIDSGIG